MRERGYSLVEMMVITGIVSVLLAIATINFNSYSKRYRNESQTRMIYDELLRARANAVYQRRAIAVRVYANRFEIYSSDQDITKGAAPVQTLSLPIPVTSNSRSGDGVKGYPLGFNNRGLSTNSCTVCLQNDDASASVDSVTVYDTRISIGKKDKGDECKAANVTFK